MNRYRIQHKVKTLSELSFPEPIEIEGYKIENMFFSMKKGPYGDARIVEKIMKSDTYVEAINLFRKEFNSIAQKLCFVSQCYFDFKHESYLIERIDNNLERIFILNDIRIRKPIGLSFMDEELENYKKLKNMSEDEIIGLSYVQDCINTTGYKAKLLLLFVACEALSGKVVDYRVDGTIRKINYNEHNMVSILGEMKEEVFAPSGLRNQLIHGDIIDLDKDYLSIIFEKILEYFNGKYGTTLDTKIVSPQRHFWGNKNKLSGFFKPVNKEQRIDLRDIPEDLYSKDSLFVQPENANVSLVY